MKKWDKNERWELAVKLEGIIGADIELNEVEAIRDAIRLFCPEFADMRDREERDVVEWLETTSDEEKEQFVREETEKRKIAQMELNKSVRLKAEMTPWAVRFIESWKEGR